MTSAPRILVPAAAIAALLVAWQVAAEAGLARLKVIASPVAVVRELVDDPGLYAKAVLVTGDVAVRGWLIGSAAAVLTAIVFVQLAVAEKVLMRVALALFCIPEIVLMPIFQVSLSPDAARVALAAVAVYFTTLVSTLLGLRSADPGALVLVRSWGGGPVGALRWVRLRATLPAVLGGLQIGVPAAVLGAMLGEFLGATTGLGVIVIGGLTSLDLERVWAVALVVTLLGSAVYALLGWAIRASAPWTTASAAAQAAAPPPVATHLPPWRRLAQGALWTAVSVAAVFGAWWGFIALLDLSPFFAKTPLDVWHHLVTDPEAATSRSRVADAIGVTLLHAGVGLVAGLVVGVGTAVLFVTVPWTESAFGPVAIALRSVPFVVTIPVLVLALGRDLLAVAAITSVATFFPTLSTVATALRQTPSDALLVMHSYAAGPGQRLWRVQLPFALPAVFASLRLAAPAAILGATLAEWLATADGMGHLIIAARSTSDYAELWAGAACLTAVSLVVYGAVSATERGVLGRYAAHHTH